MEQILDLEKQLYPLLIPNDDIQRLLWIPGIGKMNAFNILLEVDDKALQTKFEEHGAVVSAKVITDRNTGRSRGFGFVEMENTTDAQAAIKALNESEFEGRNIVVNEAKPRD